MDEVKTRIIGYVKIINKSTINDELLDYCVADILDRALSYMNREDIPTLLERPLAGAVNSVLIKCSANINGSNDRAVNSVSDNGQSISYANEVTNYFATATDNEIFSGVSSLMSRYRRIKVVITETV